MLKDKKRLELWLQYDRKNTNHRENLLDDTKQLEGSPNLKTERFCNFHLS